MTEIGHGTNSFWPAPRYSLVEGWPGAQSGIVSGWLAREPAHYNSHFMGCVSTAGGRGFGGRLPDREPS